MRRAGAPWAGLDTLTRLLTADIERVESLTQLSWRWSFWTTHPRSATGVMEDASIAPRPRERESNQSSGARALEALDARLPAGANPPPSTFRIAVRQTRSKAARIASASPTSCAGSKYPT